MKLRFRSVDGKEVTKLEVPDPCSLHQLRRILLQHLSMLPQPPPSSVRFSLNRNDELQASSPDDTLQSLGVMPGDLLFYSLRPNSDSQQVVVSPNPNSPNSERIDLGHISVGFGDSPSGNPSNSDFSPENWSFDPQGSVMCAVSDDSSVQEVNSIDREDRDQDSDVLGVQNDENLSDSSLLAEDMDLDGNVNVVACDKFSGPYFLRRVLRAELDGNKAYDDHRILVLAIHAVMMESGFVGIDPVTKMRVDRFYLPEMWPSLAFSMSLNYSFPEIPLGRGSSTESVVLRFHMLGHFMTVYGSLDKGKSDLRRVCVNESVVSPKIESLLLSFDCNAAKEVSEFWKIVKDDLVLPLSIDLSERAGLILPSCFARLPVELKAKILESLTGIDLARVSCVCSELLYLSTNNDLWKQKCIEEFGSRFLAVQGATSRVVTVNWKRVFLRSWKQQKMKSALHTCPRSLFRCLSFSSAEIPIPAFDRIGREPRLFAGPYIIGRDHDQLPLRITDPHSGPSALPLPRNLLRGGVVHRCSLGGAQG